MHHDISYPEALELLERYPYFIYAAIIALPLAPDDETRQRLQAIISLNTPGKQNAPAPAATSHKKECQSTVDAIDAFLAGHDPSGITQTPYIPGDGLPEPAPASGHTPPADTSLLPSLIKNRKYAEALAIIEELNLKNPEKSIYFADQLRFLQKLIINQQYLKQK